MQFRLLLVLGLFSWQIAGSQSLYFKHLSVNEGLSQAVNNCIYRDTRGFVWISSFDGLNRFDGLSCTVFRSGQAQSEGLKGTLFLNILEDSAANLWIGSNQGLNMYDRLKNRFFNYAVPGRNSEQFYSPFYIDEEQNVWLQSGSELFRFHPSSKRFDKINTPLTQGGMLVKPLPNTPLKQLEQLLIVHQGRPVIYRGVWQRNIMRWDSMQMAGITSPITSLLAENSNSAWIGTRQGLFYMQAGSAQLLSFTKDWHVSALLPSGNGGLWIGTQQHGLIQTNAARNAVANHYQYTSFGSNSLSGNQVQYLSSDSMQNLWVAVWGKGIDYCNLAKFRFTNYVTRNIASQHETDNFIRPIVQVGNYTWVGTQAAGIFILDSNQQVVGTIKKGIPTSIEHLHVVKPNEVWAATVDGLFKISTSSFKITRLSKPGMQFNFIGDADSNHVLLSANSGLWMGNKKSGHIQPLKGLANEVYLTSFRDSKGTLYLSRPFKGITIARLVEDSLQLIKNIPIDATIKCFYESNDSSLWIGSTQGLLKFNTRSYQVKKKFTTTEGLSNQYIYGIVPDGDYLWLSTNAGLNRFHSKQYSNKIFTVNDGLQSNEFNTYAFSKTAKGIIQFGGINGLNAFDPSAITTYSHPPQLQLTSIQINDTASLKDQNSSEISSLVLPYSHNTISLQFTVLHYDDPSANSIQYKLEGFDKRWVHAGNKSLVRYAKLPAGNYFLLVKSFNANGQSSDHVFSLPITISTPWWQSWWFRTMMILIACFITILIAKTYTRRKLVHQRQQMEKELAVEQERTRMARDLHDGLGGMLSGIKHAVAALKLRTEASGINETLLAKTLGMLDDSILELRRVAYSMTPPSLSESGLDTALRDFCASVSVAEGLQVRYQSMGMEMLHLNEANSLAIYRMVQELVNNIIKHAHASETLVQLSVDEGKLSVTVEDNGIGFDEKKLQASKGMGWKNIRNRVAALPGIIDLQTAPGKGSSVYIEINLH
jgi:signal transduction histidine kinase/ligand-binding sensor domain-containing protein